jgi:DNA topoisomerase-1
VPEDKGRIVVAFLESFFQRYVEYDFTASLEEQLDKVSNNEMAWRDLLRDFWIGFTRAVAEIKDLRITEVLDALNELLGPHIFPARVDGGDARQCPSCGEGRLSLKVGKFGAFIGCSRYPECRHTRQLATTGPAAVAATRVLGTDPETGLEVTLRGGRFGPYVQLGEGSKEEKPKRAGLPRDLAPDDVDLEKALALLSLPRNVGRHPEDGEPILAGIGRFGPYVQHNKTYANLEPGDEVLTIGLNRAVTLIAEKLLKPSKGRRFGADPGRNLGDHPDKGGPIVVKKGRYGPYVSHDGVNATLPNDKTPEAVTLEEAVALIDARIEAGGGRKAKKAPAKKAAKAKAAEAETKAGAKPEKKAAPRKKVTPAKATKTPAKKPASKKPATAAE